LISLFYNVKTMNNKNYAEVVGRDRLEKAAEALKKNGINAIIAETKNEARDKALDLIPLDSAVMNMTSVTLDSIGLSEAINSSGKYRPVRESINSESDARIKRQLGAAPDIAIGSVHAVTENGQVIIASATGSQLPAYAYGAEKVIWIVGGQKVVADMDEGMKRLKEYVFPLEDERAKKAYGVGSGINKVLIVSKEFTPDRITIILVNESLGF